MSAYAGLGDEADRMTPTQVAALAHTRVLLASCGGAHTAALTDSGDLWTWGEGGWGQLGQTTGEDSLSPVLLERKLFGDARIAMVACGGGHTCAISEGGYLFSWGSGLWGQLANRARTDRLAPGLVDPALMDNDPCLFVACGANHTAVITFRVVDEDGHFRTVKSRSGHIPIDVWEGCEGKESGGGRLWTWGRGEDGRLGHNDAEDRLVPTLVRAAWLLPGYTACRVYMFFM